MTLKRLRLKSFTISMMSAKDRLSDYYGGDNDDQQNPQTHRRETGTAQAMMAQFCKHSC
jgi:hypothetical protein